MSTAATLLSSLTSSGKKSRTCKCCRSATCANQQQAAANKQGTSSSTSQPSTGTKSKKGNWGLKFNCAKLRGTKSSNTAAAASVPPEAAAPSEFSQNQLTTNNNSRLLARSESEKTDSCICTAYRKVEDLPSTVSSNNGYPLSSTSPLVIPHESLRYHHHHHLEGPTGAGAGGLGPGARQSPFLLPTTTTTSIAAPSAVNAAVSTVGTGTTTHHDHHHHPGTTTTATIIHRIEGTAAQALWGSAAGLPAPNSVILLELSRFNSNDDFYGEDCEERARRQRELEIREGIDASPSFAPRAALMSGGTLTSAAGLATGVPGGPGNCSVALLCSQDSLSLLQRRLLLSNNLLHGDDGGQKVHSQVDFRHYLVPDLQKITNCCFYWGKMDRYEAEKLLEGKPEGTFLLRDSAQEEFLFSVSFRKYSRSLHARIEQFNNMFSFDSRDPGVYTAPTVTGLLEHYKDPSCVMFFEPMLTYPLSRKFVFSLQQLCRATIVSNIKYDGISELCLPKSLKAYLKEYHYKQRVRRRDVEDQHLYDGM